MEYDPSDILSVADFDSDWVSQTFCAEDTGKRNFSYKRALREPASLLPLSSRRGSFRARVVYFIQEEDTPRQ